MNRILAIPLIVAWFSLAAGGQEVLIGYFGPSDPSHPRGGDMWRAAELAVEEANARGGFRGRRFRLVAAWSENPWGTGVAQLARIVYVEKVRAIVGGIDGSSTHLAEQVAAKARLVLIGPAGTDKTVNLANLPWMFSCMPGDHRLAPLLAAEIHDYLETDPLVVVSTTDHDSHLFTVELKKAMVARRLVPRYHFQCTPAAEGFQEPVARVVRSDARAVVVVAGVEDSVELITALRRAGFAGRIYGGPAMGRRRFLEGAGTAAEGVVFPLLYYPRQPAAEFEKTFKRRFAVSPDYAAAGAYDAVKLLIAAIEKAGLDRAGIRDAVRELAPWPGVTGAVAWDSSGGNTRAVRLGTISAGRVVPLDLSCKAAPAGDGADRGGTVAADGGGLTGPR